VVVSVLRFTVSHGVNVKGNVDAPHPPTWYSTSGFFAPPATLPTLPPLPHWHIPDIYVSRVWSYDDLARRMFTYRE